MLNALRELSTFYIFKLYLWSEHKITDIAIHGHKPSIS